MKKSTVLLWILLLGVAHIDAQDVKTTDDLNQTEQRWPKIITVRNAVITVYQPQLETFKDNQLTCRAAVSVKRDNIEKTDYCAVWMKASLDTDKETRIVKLRDLEITKIAYPDTSDKVKESLGNIIRKNMLKADFDISLDRLIAMMDVVEKQEKIDNNIKSPVPEFFFSTKPAVLVHIDGAPVYNNLDGDYAQILNTRFLIVLDRKTETYYLRCADMWFDSKDLTGDNWTHLKNVPKEVSDLNKEDNTSAGDNAVVPKIYVSTKPSELIQCDGVPQLGYIPGTNLSYLKNSDNDLFRDEENNQLYLLVSGRWFTAPVKEGPWKSIMSDKLPEDFKKIPSNSPKADVLTSVAGTVEANDAVMESFIPQTATIKRGKVSLDIVYDGEPEFKEIEGTSMSYAVNTETPVVKLNNRYYACDNGAWYESDSPKGMWDVCAKVPDEIYKIPPSCPIYNATFVKVYDVEDDYVDVGYTSGYNHSYIYGGTLVFGTGYLYHLWCRYNWCPRPVTYGCRYRYNPYLARWCRYDRYRDNSGRYVAWNNRRNPNIRPLPLRGYGEYRTKQSIARKYNAYKNNKHVIQKPISAQTKQLIAERSIATNRPKNNVYVGKDGRIYKHGLNGWQQQNRGHWEKTRPTTAIKKPVTSVRPNRPAVMPAKPHITPRPYKTPTRDLNSQYRARQRSNYRQTTYSRARATYSRYRAPSSRSRSVRGGISRGGRGGRR